MAAGKFYKYKKTTYKSKSKSTRAIAVSNRRAIGKKEIKFVDQALLNTNILSAAPHVQELNLIAVGNDDNTRIGSKVSMRNVSMHVIAQSSAANLEGWLRFLIVKDNMPDGAQAAATDVITAAATAFSNMTDFPIYVAKPRFKILKDRVIKFAGSAATNTQAFRLNCKLNMPVHYQLDTGLIAALQKNTIYLYILSSEAANGPSVTYNTRLYYSDI